MRPLTFFQALTAVLAATATAHAGLDQSIPEIERDALVAIYNSTDGPGWYQSDGWLGPPGSEASWFGVTVENRHVVGLRLSSNFLAGPLPPEIGDLTELKELSLWGGDVLPTWPPFLSNDITGAIPPEIGRLTALEYLDLGVNRLEGPVPPEIGNLTNLVVLSLSGNELSEIPPQLGNLRKLRELQLAGNTLGDLPPEIGSLIDLELLTLGGSSLVEFPEVIGSLSALRNLQFRNSQISSLHPSIGNLKLLEELDLRGNLLAHLPESTGDLRELKRLDVSRNQLLDLPHSIGNLEGLEELILSRNLLERLPDEYGFLESLEGIEISHNPLLELPSSVGNLKNVTYLNMSATSLISLPAELGDIPELSTVTMSFGSQTSLPAGIGWLRQVKSLHVNDNLLTDLPEEMAGMQSLEELDISNNRMKKLPTVIGELDALITLEFHGNPLVKGPIPEALFTLDWEVLDLSGFGFTGTIPASLAGMDTLRELDLSRNLLTGTIPPELATLPNLEVLDLSRNQLYGPIPPQLGHAQNLESLSLGRNNLWGSIPAELASVPYLSLPGNSLTGSIPPELGLVGHLNLSDNELSGEIPAALGQVESLVLSLNLLTGSLPAEFCASTGVENFRAADNHLEGTLQALAECLNLTALDLSRNRLSGRIPPEFSELALRHLVLSSNRLTGPVPPDIIEEDRSYNEILSLTWNGLYAETPEVQEFLEKSHHAEHAFEFTQTVAPFDLRVEPLAGTEVDLHWSRIPFFFRPGAYEVFYATKPGGPYRFLARTGSKADDSIRLSGLETDTEYHFVVRAVTDPHEDNLNRVFSEIGPEVAAPTGGPAGLIFPLFVSTAGSSTGLALASDTDHGIAARAEALGRDGSQWPVNGNPAFLDVPPASQSSFLGEQLLGAGSPLEAQGWLRVTAENSRLGTLFLVGGGVQLDGGVAATTASRKLYFTRVYDGPQSFRNQMAKTVLSLVNPSSEIVGVRLRHVSQLRLAGSGTIAAETEIRRSIRPGGMILSSARELFERELSEGFIEVRVTRGPGVVGFEMIELPQHGTLISLAAQTDTVNERLSVGQVAWGAPFFTNLNLINTSAEARSVTLSLVTAPRQRAADPVRVLLAPRSSFCADVASVFGLGPGPVADGSLRVATSGPGVVGDVVIGNSESLAFATALPLQAGGFVAQMFAHVVSTSSVFTGLALDNPFSEPSEIKVTAFHPDGSEAGSVDMFLPAWARHSALLTQLIPSVRNQVGGYLRVESSGRLTAVQLFGATDLSFLAAVPPSRTLRAPVDLE